MFTFCTQEAWLACKIKGRNADCCTVALSRFNLGGLAHAVLREQTSNAKKRQK